MYRRRRTTGSLEAAADLLRILAGLAVAVCAIFLFVSAQTYAYLFPTAFAITAAFNIFKGLSALHSASRAYIVRAGGIVRMAVGGMLALLAVVSLVGIL